MELADLGNISDTNNCFRKIADSVFTRKYANHLISFDAILYSRGINASEIEFHNSYEDIYCKNKLLIKITDAKIWFILLRNFGKSIKFIRIRCPLRHAVRLDPTKIPNALENLIKYVKEYCADSLEALEMFNYPYFTWDRPFPKLQEFTTECCFDFGHEPLTTCRMNWNTVTLEFMPNIRSPRLRFVPKLLEEHFSKLDRVILYLEHDEDVHSFIRFLQSNPQINYLSVIIGRHMSKYHNLIYSSIEKNLTQLKVFKITDNGTRKYEENAMESIPRYGFRTVNTFRICC